MKNAVFRRAPSDASAKAPERPLPQRPSIPDPTLPPGSGTLQARPPHGCDLTPHGSAHAPTTPAH